MATASGALTACGAGGGSSSNGSAGGALAGTGNLAVIAASPMDQAIEQPVGSVVRIDFDGAVMAASLRQPETGLVEAQSGTAVPGTTTFENGGTTLVFTPAQQLNKETSYRFRLSPLTVDTTGRILDTDWSTTFRTEDDVAPTVTGASIVPGQAGVSRTAPITITFSEDLAPSSASSATVTLRDPLGTPQACSVQVVGSQLTVDALADLAGNQTWAIVIRGGSGGVQDLAGNPLAAPWTIGFTTQPDTQPPAALALWPSAGSPVSPRVEPRLQFDESIDPGSIEPASLQWTNDIGALVPFTVVPSADRRELRLVPSSSLTPGKSYTVTLAGGAAGVTDFSGNPLPRPSVLSFVAGTDSTPPSVTASTPANGAQQVALNALLDATLSEPVDPARVSSRTVELQDVNGKVLTTTLSLDTSGTTLRVTPTQDLAPGIAHVVLLRGGADGIRDLAGNALARDVQLGFTTTPDSTTPSVLLLPAHGSAAVPTTAHLTAVFDQPIEPATVTPTSVQVVGPAGTVQGTLTISRGNRVVRFTPDNPWTAQAWYTWTIRGGAQGVLEPSGNALPGDQTSRFRAGTSSDVTAPVVRVTLNAADDLRKQSMSVPNSGFDIDVTAVDAPDWSLDMGSCDVVISGGGVAPGPDVVFANATITNGTLRCTMPAGWALAAGDYTLTATVRDLSGNQGVSTPVSFQVRDRDPSALPFERTQVVWVRFDLDRNGNGTADLLDDLLRLGLATSGDPIGTNAHMLRVMEDGILAQCHQLLARDASGNLVDRDSVALRVTKQVPHGVPAAEIACGGLDTEGDPQRQYGSDTTGTLGRAYFDYRNGDTTDHNTGSSPGLGVFPGELFLFEAKIHKSVWPAYTTTFGRRFVALCPQMGGTPAGAHPLDNVVLAPGFDPTTAPSNQAARYNAVFSAADDWATAIGVVLAHEIGHSVGLVAQGPGPRGLHGDASLHDEYAINTDVMASAVGYDSLVMLSYQFRDLDIAYLRQRLVLK